jgi:hypothetical protein
MRTLFACLVVLTMLFAGTAAHAQRVSRPAPRPRAGLVDRATNLVPRPVRKVVKAFSLPIYLGVAAGSIGATIGSIGGLAGPLGLVAGVLTGGAMGTAFGVKLGAQLGLVILGSE